MFLGCTDWEYQVHDRGDSKRTVYGCKFKYHTLYFIRGYVCTYEDAIKYINKNYNGDDRVERVAKVTEARDMLESGIGIYG